MKITKLETVRVAERSNLLWVLVHTDEGITGLGETFFGAETVESYIHEYVAPRVIGRDPLDRKIDKNADTYWKERERTPVDPESYGRQY